ncbi:MAG: cysteine hydrolase [Patescibacteria group bacterium]
MHAQTLNLNGPAEFIRIISENGNSLGLSGFEQEKAITTWSVMLKAAANSGRKIPLWERLDSKQTALIVVDMQNAFVAAGAPIEIAKGREITGIINILADIVRKKRGKVIWIQYSIEKDKGFLAPFESRSYIDQKRISPLEACLPGNPLFEIYPDLNVSQKDIRIKKNRYCASYSTLKPSLRETLRSNNIKNVIIAGVSTDVCAGGTAEGLAQTGFNVIVAWDGTAALDRLIGHEGYLARLWILYCEVMTTKQIISLLN